MCIVVLPTDDVPKIELQIYYVCYPATENEFKTTNPGINYLFCKSAQYIKCAFSQYESIVEPNSHQSERVISILKNQWNIHVICNTKIVKYKL